MITDKWTWGVLFLVLVLQGYRFYHANKKSKPHG